MKPGLRPKRRMKSATGMVEHMVPMTNVESGNVARARDGANVVPTSPAVAKQAYRGRPIKCVGDRQDDRGMFGARSSRSMSTPGTPLEP